METRGSFAAFKLESTNSVISASPYLKEPAPDRPSFTQHQHYRKVGSLCYLGLLAPLCIGLLYVPSVSAMTSGYKDAYYTDTFQFSKLLYFILINASGFIYVTAITLRLRRKSIISGRHHSYRDFLACIFLGTAIFFLGPNATLKGFDDTSSLGVLVLYDYCAWTTAFWLGINWSHLDVKCLRKFTLNFNEMRVWPCQLWLLFVVAVLLLFGAAGYEMYLLYDRGLLYYELIGYGAFCVLIFLIWLCIRHTHEFHLHHYQLFAVIVPMTMTQHWLSAIVQGFSIGAFIEGLARWGLANCFKRIK